MTNAYTLWERIRRADLALAAVIVVATVSRGAYIGLHHVIRDEAATLLAAIRLVRHGEWTWLSYNVTSWDRVSHHSPLTVYLAAIPYLFTPEPRVVRMWVALLAVGAVGLSYWVMRRYFGATTALIGGLLLAAHVPLVDWSRFGWNTNYGQIFIAAWVLTGLVGYHEGKRWAQIAHWPALSAAIQCHPANFLLTPLSFLLVALDLIRNKSERRAAIKNTLLGWLLFALSLTPWAYGLISYNPEKYTLDELRGAALDVAESEQRAELDFGEMVDKYSSLLGSTGRRLAPALFSTNGQWYADEAPGNWWPPAWAENVYRAQSALTFASMLVVLAMGLWRRQNTPHLLLALTGLWMLSVFFVSPVSDISLSHMMALIFGAVPALGAVLGMIAKRGQWPRLVAFAVTGVFVVAQTWLTVATLRGAILYGNHMRFDAPMDTYLSALNAWEKAGQGRETIIIAETTEGKRTPFVQNVYWTTLIEGRPVRVIVEDEVQQGIPIPAGGAVFASAFDGPTIPAMFGEGQTFGTLHTGEPMYRWVLVTQPPDIPLKLVPEDFSLFANGARILGLQMDAPPKPGEEWPVTLVWRIVRTDLAADYSFSVRLMDSAGNVFGQADGLSLNAGLWRKGDTVINRFRLPVSGGYPTGSVLRARLLMYTADSVPVADEGWTALGTEMPLVPDGSVTDSRGWFEFHPPDDYAALTSHQYFARLESGIRLLTFDAPQAEASPGGSIPVTLYWSADTPQTTDYRIFVHLRDADGKLWGQSDKVAPADSPTSHWVPGQYVIDRHSVVLSPDIQPGEHQLYVGLWDEGSGQRVTAFDENEMALGDSVPLPIVISVRP